ncbi:hypothetical protein VPH526E571_0022 [Vibrio phage 526E57-1]
METTQANESSLLPLKDSVSTLHATTSGEKPFSVVDKKKDPWLFNQVMLNAELLDVRMHYHNELAFTKKAPNSYMLHNKYLALHRIRVTREMSRAEFQRQMGRLFGYSHESIEAFIESGDYCGCRNCGGHQLT